MYHQYFFRRQSYLLCLLGFFQADLLVHYKKYAANANGISNFYNVQKDPLERNPITRANMTAAEKNIDDKFMLQLKSLQ